MTIEDFTEFEVLEKVGMLREGGWLIHSFVSYKHGNYYRVTTHDCENYRVIGIIDQSKIDLAISEGKIVVGKKAKIKIKKDKGLDKAKGM